MPNDIEYTGRPSAVVSSAWWRKSGVGITSIDGPTPPSTTSPATITTWSSATLSAATRSWTRPFRSDDRPLAWTGK